MRISEAIELADMLRPNTVPFPEKVRHLHKIEAEVAETMEVDIPEWADVKTEDYELLAGDPYTELYTNSLAAFIDYYQEETDLYQLDSIMANQAMSDWKSWRTRHHRSENNTRIRGVWV